MSEFNIEVEGGSSVRLPTAGKYCDRDIVVTAKGGGEEVFLNTTGDQLYTRRVIVPAGSATKVMSIHDAPELEYLEINVPYDIVAWVGFSASGAWARNPKLKTAIINAHLTYGNHCEEFKNCIALEYMQFGGLGTHSEPKHGLILNGCTNENLVVVVYVLAEKFADIDSQIINTSPWGATNATIIYRSATTGEVIEV